MAANGAGKAQFIKDLCFFFDIIDAWPKASDEASKRAAAILALRGLNIFL